MRPPRYFRPSVDALRNISRPYLALYISVILAGVLVVVWLIS